jgi:hypothetical protein
MRSLSTDHQNARKSFNVRLRAVCAAMTGLGTVTWLPNPWDVTVYPGVRPTWVYHGRWNARKRKFESRIQLSVFTANKQSGLADRIVGQVLSILGFDPEAQVMETDIPLRDYEAGTDELLLPMQLEWVSGPEPGPVTESAETHQMMDFRLYF